METRILSVSYQQDSSDRGGVAYRQEMLPVGTGTQATRPVTEFKLVPSRDSVQRLIRDIKLRVDELNTRAVAGAKRGDLSVEDAALRLAKQILPECGFIKMTAPPIHPQLDTFARDIVEQIPWEAMEEYFMECPEPDCTRRFIVPPAIMLDFYQQLALGKKVFHKDLLWDYLRDLDHPDWPGPYCSRHRSEMRLGGDKLALTYHFSHVIRDAYKGPSRSREWLFIIDPHDDPLNSLFSKYSDGKGQCKSHVARLESLLEARGYNITRVKYRDAKVGKVLALLEQREFAGIYYFGHGDFCNESRQGQLILADGPLPARQIADAAPNAKLIFLNACQSGAAGDQWDIEREPHSLARAFSVNDGNKVVIAPIYSVVNNQAARAAIDFFETALSPDKTLSESLAEARRNSLERYRQDQPDIAWMAYRYFGDPFKTMPGLAAAAEQIVETAEPPVEYDLSVFDAAGRLQNEAFGLEMTPVLLWAGKRMTNQNRESLTPNDLLAGLVGKGDLTRSLLREHRIDPDELYERIGQLPEMEPSATSPRDPAQPRGGQPGTSDLQNGRFEEHLLRDVLPTERTHYGPELLRLLENAEGLARAHVDTDTKIIHEADLLRSFLATENWPSEQLGVMPDAATALHTLETLLSDGEMDDSGVLRLDELTPAARRIVDNAHRLAQQRGHFPIPHRIVLIAFLTQLEGAAERLIREVDKNPELLTGKLLQVTKAESPRTFGLGSEAVRPVIAPMLEAAAKFAGPSSKISEQMLFRGFCQSASADFKEFLVTTGDVNLDELRFPEGDWEPRLNDEWPLTDDEELDLTALDDEARHIIETAHRSAQEWGLRYIPNRVLMAAFVERQDTFTSRLLAELGVDVCEVADNMRAASKGSEPSTFPLESKAAKRIVLPVLKAARLAAVDPACITEAELLRAFCERSNSQFKTWLHSLIPQFDWDCLRRALADILPPTPPRRPEAPDTPASGPSDSDDTPSGDPETTLLKQPSSDDAPEEGPPAAVQGEPEKGEPGAVISDDVNWSLTGNGTLDLAILDVGARRVIETAHNLTQEFGLRELPNRLLFAAFLAQPEGHVVRLVAELGINAAGVAAHLLETTERRGSFVFPFKPSVAERIVLPTLETARRIAADPARITEAELFRAFCDRADLNFKIAVRSLVPGLDMDRLRHAQSSVASPAVPEGGPEPAGISTSDFEPSAWRLMREAAQFAYLQGWLEIKSPHLFAALLELPDSPAQTVMLRAGFGVARISELKDYVLQLVPPRQAPPTMPETPRISVHVEHILTRARRFAAEQRREQVSMADIHRSFFADGGGVVAQLLNQVDPRLTEMIASAAETVARHEEGE
ncbi:MAG: CHAT domain-containing protein [Candidatus Lernaella stagnicola]|nr:CHAT domain-containing protein [Candidatus Lernaella stagnicola]